MKKKKGFWALNIGLLYILPWLVGFLLYQGISICIFAVLQLYQL